MGLHWIVPARRATVTPGGASYAEVIDGWLQELSTCREALLRWYGPLVSPSARAGLGRDLDEAVQMVRRWRDRMLASDRAPRQAAVRLVSSASDETIDATLADVGFAPRLWRGPLRVLLEEAQRLAAEDAVVSSSPRTEIDHGGPVVLVESSDHEVLNANARFLPGDVVELPLFRLWEYAGLRMFAGARFSAAGSFLLGDAVQLPPGARLHDNLVAMRLQLIHHAARGAYYSLDPVWRPESGPASTCNRATQRQLGHGREVWGRGLIYASSLGPPNPRGVDDRFWIDLREWCALDRVERRSHAPNAAAMWALPEQMPITLGWTCVTCTLATFYVIMNHVGRGWSPGGGMGRQARRPDLTDHPVSQATTTYLHFDRRFKGKNLPEPKRGKKKGTWAVSPEQAAQQQHEVARLMVTRLGGDLEEVTESHREALDREIAATERAIAATKNDRAKRKLQRQRDELVARRSAADLERQAAGHWLQECGLGMLLGDPNAVDRADGPDEDDALEDDAQEDDDTDLEVRGAQSPQERSPIEQSWTQLDEGTEVQIPQHAIDEVFGAMNFVTLSGHEYAYIKIFPHARMRDEPAAADGPPQVGPLCVYNPLTGLPYDAAPTGTLYLHEATGTLANSEWIKGIERKYYAKMNGSRPARWAKLDQLWLRRESNGNVHIGEVGEGRNFSGVRSRKTRSKTLDSLLVVSEAEIREVYAQPAPQGYVPFVLDDRKRSDPRRFYDTRAVPYATMKEAEAYPCHDTWQATHQELRRKKQVLSELIDVTAPYALTAAGKTFIVTHKINATKLDAQAEKYEAGLEKRKDRLPKEIERADADHTKATKDLAALEEKKRAIDAKTKAANEARTKADAALTEAEEVDHGGRRARRKALQPFNGAVDAAKSQQKEAKRALRKLSYDKNRKKLLQRQASAKAKAAQLRAEQKKVDEALEDPRAAIERETIEGWRRKLQVMLHEYDVSIPAP